MKNSSQNTGPSPKGTPGLEQITKSEADTAWSGKFVSAMLQHYWILPQKDMRHSDFKIGTEFKCGDNRWRCTDIGTRTIIAIQLDHDDDPSWYNGPPYGVAEMVFDEYDFGGCHQDDRETKF